MNLTWYSGRDVKSYKWENILVYEILTFTAKNYIYYNNKAVPISMLYCHVPFISTISLTYSEFRVLLAHVKQY